MNIKKASILAVDDDEDILITLKMLLKPEVEVIMTEKNPELLPGILSKNKFDLVLLDMNFKSALNSGNEGIYWLRKIKQINKNLPVIMITAYGDIDVAVNSLKEGASDFVLKPWRNEKLIEALTSALNLSEDQEKNISKKNTLLNSNPFEFNGGPSSIIGQSEVMTEIFYKINKIAPTDANILILGENGTGKDLIAKEIYSKSLRKDKTFVSVDLGALTETLFESELFGHKKGAYTDAREDRAGRFEEANNGTIFLDEIGNISLLQQAKLLSVIQNKQITRLGTNSTTPVDVRIISATNAPLYIMANENKFRKDLIYRLNTIEILLPPLRERGNDVILLANHFLQLNTQKYLKSNKVHFSEEAIKKIKNYSFPGNIRELQHTIERTVIMMEGETIYPNDLNFSSVEKGIMQQNVLPNPTKLVELEKTTIQLVIEKNNGNITKAAKELGITRTALYRRLGKYDI